MEYFLNLPMENCPPMSSQKQQNELRSFIQDNYDS